MVPGLDPKMIDQPHSYSDCGTTSTVSEVPEMQGERWSDRGECWSRGLGAAVSTRVSAFAGRVTQAQPLLCHTVMMLSAPYWRFCQTRR